MEYAKKSINGDAGEYLVAFRVTRILGWPCRLHDVDLGVDAEMEVMGELGGTTGDIIKIQVKSVDKIGEKASHAVTVDDRHIEYWKRFCLPVIIVCVDLTSEKIYWKQIFATEAYETKGASKKVLFSLADDILGVASKPKLRRLAYPVEARNIDKEFESLRALLKKYGTLSPVGGEELQVAIWGEKEISAQPRRIETIMTHCPWRLSQFDKGELDMAKYSLSQLKIGIDEGRNDWTEGG